jgi:hypothetical protein
MNRLAGVQPKSGAGGLTGILKQCYNQSRANSCFISGTSYMMRLL